MVHGKVGPIKKHCARDVRRVANGQSKRSSSTLPAVLEMVDT